jgi:hypothetical protein
MTEQSGRASDALEEVTHSAFNGVLRAVEARGLGLERFPGPILVGIIAWPELSQLSSARVAGQLQQAAGSARPESGA